MRKPELRDVVALSVTIVNQCEEDILTKMSLLSNVELYLVMIDRNKDEMDKGWS